LVGIPINATFGAYAHGDRRVNIRQVARRRRRIQSNRFFRWGDACCRPELAAHSEFCGSKNKKPATTVAVASHYVVTRRPILLCDDFFEGGTAFSRDLCHPSSISFGNSLYRAQHPDPHPSQSCHWATLNYSGCPCWDRIRPSGLALPLIRFLPEARASFTVGFGLLPPAIFRGSITLNQQHPNSRCCCFFFWWFPLKGTASQHSATLLRLPRRWSWQPRRNLGDGKAVLAISTWDSNVSRGFSRSVQIGGWNSSPPDRAGR